MPARKPTKLDTPGHRDLPASASRAAGVAPLEMWLSTLQDIQRVLAGAESIAAAGQAILQLVSKATDSGAAMRWQVSGAGLQCAESWTDAGVAGELLLASVQRSSERAGPGDMLRAARDSGKPVLVPDLGLEVAGTHAVPSRQTGWRSAFAIPLQSDGSVTGIFQFFSRGEQAGQPGLASACNFIAAQFEQFIQRQRTERQVRDSDAFARKLADIAADWYWEHDAQSRVIFLSPSIRDAIGVDPQTVIGKSRAKLRGTKPLNCTWEQYDAIIEARQPYRDLEYRRTNDQGEQVYYMVSGVPVFDTDGEFRGYRGVGRNITARRRAEFATQRIARMFATLSATNEVNTRARSSEELYQKLCEAAVHSGHFTLAGVLICGDMPGEVRVVATAGQAAEMLHEGGVSLDPSQATGQGLVGTAFHSGRASITNDFLQDERTRPWHAQAHRHGVAAAAALPLHRGGRVVGVLLFFLEEQGAFDDECVELLERMSANVSFALDNFDREAERQRAEQALRESEARFRSLTELSSDWYWETDEELRIVFSSNQRSLAYDRSLRKSEPMRRWEFPDATPLSGSWAEHKEQVLARQPFRDFEYSRLDEDGRPYYLSVSGAPTYDEHGRFTGYRGVGRDITERKLAEERIQYLATHDGLTGLPNRAMFSQLLNVALETARRNTRQLAVLFIDLDRFKYVNDNLGHAAGDELLKQMSKRFKDCLRASDVVARLGGDEFVVMLQDVHDQQEAATAARKILSAAIQPLQVLGHECRVTASVGISLYPVDALDEKSLMKSADLAMYKAKEEGKNNCQFYSREGTPNSVKRTSIDAQLRHAIEHNEFSMHYQAKCDMHSGLITGVEALLRWNSATLGAVTPTQFIPVAEETGLIVPIGRWALFTACAQSVAWQQAGLPPVCVAVNISPKQFADPGLLADVEGALTSTGLAPALLELELSESMVFHDTRQTLKRLAAIKALGVRIAIDDFGVGYSSLAQLQDFPIDTLKVDRSFIRAIPDGVDDRGITEALIAMGKALCMTVIAEGVETQAQEDFLRLSACDQMQGFYFSKPLPATQFADFLASNLSEDRLKVRVRQAAGTGWHRTTN